MPNFPEMVSQVQPEYSDSGEQEQEDKAEENKVEEEDEEDKGKQDFDDDDGSVGSDEDEEYENPWKKLKEETMDALEPIYQKTNAAELERGCISRGGRDPGRERSPSGLQKRVTKSVFALPQINKRKFSLNSLLKEVKVPEEPDE